MIFGIITLLVAIAISAVAAWYSIVGLMAIFAAAAIPIAVMGGVLEVGKLLTASWLYHNWKICNVLLKYYLTAAVVVLMLITSMGIFGFLSKAHIDQTLVGGDNSLEIQSLDQQIEREQRAINDTEKLINQLDSSIETLIEYDRIRGADGAIAMRQSQRVERSSYTRVIEEAYSRIKSIRDQKLKLQKQQLKYEADVGPIIYIAALFSDDPKSIIGDAVRWVIISIIFVFDPLAILLLIAGNMTITKPKSIKQAVNVDDNWESFIVEEEESGFKIDDEIIQSANNTIEIVSEDLHDDKNYSLRNNKVL